MSKLFVNLLSANIEKERVPRLANLNQSSNHADEYPTVPAGTVPPRVALIVGDNHTPHCGVKDYAYTLAGTLEAKGIHADVLAPLRWDRASFAAFRKQVQAGRYDIVHLQYPSIGCRASLLPHLLGLLGLARKSVVTLHEHSALPLSQRLSLQAFRWTTSTILWASEYEQSSFNHGVGGLGASQHVIPIGSNVPESTTGCQFDNTVIYFGQIRQNKGLEAFLELARISAQAARPFHFHVIGSVTPANREFAQSLQREAPAAVQWSFDLPFADVGKLLSCSFAAYLPFPDGASERRGSMLAAFANGLPVLSQEGPATTQAIRDLILQVNNPAEALEALDHLLSLPAERLQRSQASRVYARRHGWSNIADRHAQIYYDLLNTEL